MREKLGMCGFTIGAAAYYKKFPVVEVQQTFYDPPADATMQKWRDAAPPDFEFTMKAWQVITHFGTSSTYRRLRSPFSDQQRAEAGGFRVNPTVLDAWDRTLGCAGILRATAILFQCPASFRPTPENIANMREFFSTIERPESVRFLWEPRGPWPDDTVHDLCTNLGLIHAVDPFVRPSLTPELLYWRLHGNKSHYARYTDDELLQLRTWLDDSVASEAYVLFNNIPCVKDIARYRELGLAR
jgi:uncharacterized protein YecE (DUF72 family)